MKKKNALVFLLAFVLMSVGAIAQIPNSDFEDWGHLGGSNLTGWTTNSCEVCVPPYEPYIVRQDSMDVYHGKYSAKFVYNNVFPAWAKVRFPISMRPTELTAWVKNDLFGTDTASIAISILNNGAVVDGGFWSGSSSITNYTRLVIPITQSFSLFDSAEVIIAFGNIVRTPHTDMSAFWADYLSLDFPEGINDIYSSGNALEVYPDPVGNELRIKSAVLSMTEQPIYIMNSLGQVVFQSSIINHQSSIDVSSLSSGLYFVKVAGEKESWVGKFVKE